MIEKPKKEPPEKEQKSEASATLYQLPTKLTYAAVVDVRNQETEISEFMIRRACEEMDSKQQFPFAPQKHNMRMRSAR